MSKLYVILEGLISVVEHSSDSGIDVLLVKTNPQDVDPMGMPIPPHISQIAYRAEGKLQTYQFQGEDVSFANGHLPGPPAVTRDLQRLPSFVQILGSETNAEVVAGCVGPHPATECLASAKAQPRIAGRVLITQGTLRSIQVDKKGNPASSAPQRCQFFSQADVNQIVLDMNCDNALLLEMDLGKTAAQLLINGKSVTLDAATPEGVKPLEAILGPATTAWTVVWVRDMVDPTLGGMNMDHQNIDPHFSVFYDLLANYHGPQVTPRFLSDNEKQGDQPLNRCIPPRMVRLP
jgi:hypothetical protein